MGKKMNRKFYEIPYSLFINKMKDKFNTEKVVVVAREESYTSKCDALAFEPICKQQVYSGKRVKRGLYVSKYALKERGIYCGLLNADINGAINIMRKYFKQRGWDFGNKVEGKIFNPTKLKI